MKFRKITAAMLMTAMAVSLTACGSKDTGTGGSGAESEETGNAGAESESGEKTVTLAEIWDFSAGFYPVMTASEASNYGSIYWSRNFYNTLVRYDDNGEISGELAESWEMSEDGKTYTFHLRDGVKFSDGTDLTSAAVKSSFEAAVQNLGQFNGSYGKLTTLITDVETPDDGTVVLHLSQPYYGVLNDLTMACPMAIVNPVGLNEDLTVKEAAKTQTFGTGPYMYAGDFSDNTYTFVRNPYYWGEAPEADSFKVKVIEDADARVLALRNGEIDGILGSSRLTYDAYNELSGDDSCKTAVDDAACMTRYLGLNLSKAPFDDIKVRQAVAYAVDTEGLSSSVFQGIEEPAESLFEKGKPYCGVETATYDLDVDKANLLMEEAGWVDSDGDGVREKDGQKLEYTMTYTSDHGTLDDAALAIAGQLEKIGFKSTASGSDMMTWYSTILGGDYEITIYQTYGGSFDPSAIVTNMNPDASTDPVAMQFAAFFEGGKDLITELDSTPDEERVQEIYDEILNTIADEALVVPLSYTREFGAWNSDVIENYTFYPDNLYIIAANIDVK